MDRVCSRCGQTKSEDAFYRVRRYWCRECVKAYERARRAEGKTPVTAGWKRRPWASWRTTGKKTCPICKRDLPLSEYNFTKRGEIGRYPYGWCKSCALAKHNKWLKTPKGRAAQKRNSAKRYRTDPKVAVRRLTYAAIQLGLLVRRPCEVCGVTKTQAHHTDYSQPLVVRWLCTDHHDQAHHEGRNEG